MSAQQLYTIQARLKGRESSPWSSMASFSHMRKSFSDGAWAMLRANYGGVLEYRLVTASKEPVVLDTWGSPEVRVT